MHNRCLRLKELLQNSSDERPLLNHNFDRECALKNITEEKFKVLLEIIEEFITYRENLGLPINWDDIFIHLRSPGIFKKGPYLLGNMIENRYEESYTYMSYDEFWQNCVGQKSHSKEIEIDQDINTAKEELRTELIKNKPILNKKLFRDRELKDSVTNEFFWVYRPNFDQIDIHGKDTANFVLDMIGLYYDEREIDLVQIKVSGTKLFTPTIFDGWNNEYFVPARRDDQWGQAINLKCHAGRYEGFPQSISKKMLVRNALEIKIIGKARFGFPNFDIKSLIEYLEFDLKKWSNK